jgi:hypothetical protein
MDNQRVGFAGVVTVSHFWRNFFIIAGAVLIACLLISGIYCWLRKKKERQEKEASGSYINI